MSQIINTHKSYQREPIIKFTKEQAVDYAVEVVGYLNRIVMGMELNGRVCAVKGSKNELKDCFLARAKDMIFNATREQLEAAYDECGKADTIDHTVQAMFRVIGNKAPNPGNEKPIETVLFGIV